LKVVFGPVTAAFFLRLHRQQISRSAIEGSNDIDKHSVLNKPTASLPLKVISAAV
jgi:hypothetical protein